MIDGLQPEIDFDHEVGNRVNKALDLGFPGEQPPGLKSKVANLAIPFAEEVVRSEIDPLTGLHRKEYYEPKLTEKLDNLATGSIARLGVVRMDLDYFSWVNDVLKAHALGDLYLATTGAILRKSLRPTDEVVRVGGDEFVVIEIDPVNLEGFTRSVNRMFNLLNGKILDQTLSIAVNSNRLIIDKSKQLEDREGSIAIKEFLKGLVNFKNDKSSQHSFLDRGRGERIKKGEFIKRVNKANLIRFREYLDDTRVWSELSEEERRSRRVIENNIRGVICIVMTDLSISVAGTLVTKDDSLTFSQVDSLIDRSVNVIKQQHGGGKFQIYQGDKNITLNA